MNAENSIGSSNCIKYGCNCLISTCRIGGYSQGLEDVFRSSYSSKYVRLDLFSRVRFSEQNILGILSRHLPFIWILNSLELPTISKC